MNSVETLQKEISDIATSWGVAFKTGDHRTANRQNSAITKITKKFKKDKNLGEAVLIPLFTHPVPSVKYPASVHALVLEIHQQEAEAVLAQVASDPNIHVVQLMAQISLAEWNKKKSTAHKTDESVK